MKIQLLPSSFDENGHASARQHLACFVINDRIALDAGSLGQAATDVHRRLIRDVVLTHAHLDHIAGLPLFIDDLFANLIEPITIHAAPEVIEILERDIFNWSVYPRFSELVNENSESLKYSTITDQQKFTVAGIEFLPVKVNHRVPSLGFIASENDSIFAFTGDTAETEDFWSNVNRLPKLNALFIECAFPDELEKLSCDSHHLTPRKLQKELLKLRRLDCPVYVINIKPAYRESVIRQIEELSIENVEIMQSGQIYEL